MSVCGFTLICRDCVIASMPLWPWLPQLHHDAARLLCACACTRVICRLYKAHGRHQWLWLSWHLLEQWELLTWRYCPLLPFPPCWYLTCYLPLVLCFDVQLTNELFILYSFLNFSHSDYHLPPPSNPLLLTCRSSLVVPFSCRRIFGFFLHMHILFNADSYIW